MNPNDNNNVENTILSSDTDNDPNTTNGPSVILEESRNTDRAIKGFTIKGSPGSKDNITGIFGHWSNDVEINIERCRIINHSGDGIGYVTGRIQDCEIRNCSGYGVRECHNSIIHGCLIINNKCGITSCDNVIIS
jgi:hypothetical protein